MRLTAPWRARCRFKTSQMYQPKVKPPHSEAQPSQGMKFMLRLEINSMLKEVQPEFKM